MNERDTTLSTADLASRTATNQPDPRDSDSARDPLAAAASTDIDNTTAAPSDRSPLLTEDDAGTLRIRWQEIQTGFVDEPRRAVEEADALVAELMQRLADMFAEERSQLESQWDRGDNVSTEDLRVALQRYRSFFDRLLSA